MSRGKNQRRLSRRNEHHLLWKAADYKGSYARVRLLPCCRVMLDREVHRILHKLYDYPKRISPDDADLLVSRHKRRECACYTQDGEAVNVLGINQDEGGGSDERGGDPELPDGQLRFLW